MTYNRAAIMQARLTARQAVGAAKPRTEADRIRAAIRDMECKDRLLPDDFRRLDAMRAELAAAQYRADA